VKSQRRGRGRLGGRRQPLGARRLKEPRIEGYGGDIEPHARELGCERELEGIRDILSRGSSSDGQLRIFNANRDIVEVVHAIADATEAAAKPVPVSGY